MNNGHYAQVNGLNLYYEIHGEGKPLILLHGGFGAIEMFEDVLTQLAAKRQVIGVDLYGHGRTALTDRPMSLEFMGDDIAALIDHLGYKQVDVMGYSMGGGAALQTAIRHPEKVRKLVVVSIPFKKNGWYPEIVEGMSQMDASAAEGMKQSPMYQLYSQVAPRVEDWVVLVTRMTDGLREDYDWTEGVRTIKTPTLLVFGDADGVQLEHVVDFFKLLGGGQKDGGWDGSGMPASRLAILPGTTHYNLYLSPVLPPMVHDFLDASTRFTTDPKIDERPEQHTIGIRSEVPMSELPQVIPQLIDETGAWLAKHGISTTSAPFMRFHVINMEGLMDMEIGWTVAQPVQGDDRVHAGTIPAGRYASLVYTGVERGIEGNGVLIDWGKQNGLTWDAWDSDKGHAFRSRIEFFLTGPEDNPDPAQWDTEVAIKIAD